jgi:hypothetical protein
MLTFDAGARYGEVIEIDTKLNKINGEWSGREVKPLALFQKELKTSVSQIDFTIWEPGSYGKYQKCR